LVPVEALSDPFCRQAVKMYRESHSRDEPVDLARLAFAMGGGAAMRDLMDVGLNFQADEEHALSLARLIRRRHEGAKLATELETNVSYLRYGFEADDAAERCRAALDRFYESMAGNDDATTIDAILREQGDRLFVNRRDGGHPFNIPTLDAKIGGLHGGEMIVVAARLKKGKSSLQLSLAVEADLPTCIFSLEMTKRECLRNLVCIYGHIPTDAILDYRMEVDGAKNELRRRPIYIFDRPNITAAEVAAACYLRRDVKLLIVDYAQIMGRVRGTESSRESLVENVKMLKTLAKRLDATVILGSQIGRGGDEKPTVKDLAESDELGRSADHILVFDWDDDNPPSETKWDRAPVRVTMRLTSRHMPSGTFPMAFHRSQRRFGERE
jgi:replicative DNA helicase